VRNCHLEFDDKPFQELSLALADRLYTPDRAGTLYRGADWRCRWRFEVRRLGSIRALDLRTPGPLDSPSKSVPGSAEAPGRLPLGTGFDSGRANCGISKHILDPSAPKRLCRGPQATNWRKCWPPHGRSGHRGHQSPVEVVSQAHWASWAGGLIGKVVDAGAQVGRPLIQDVSTAFHGCRASRRRSIPLMVR